MSDRGLSIFLSVFGISLSLMSIWREVQQRARQLTQDRHWKPVRVLGLDRAYLCGWGKTQPVLVAVDMGSGKPVIVGYVDEKDPQEVKRFLEPLLQGLGISVVFTDDLLTYRIVTNQLGLEQQVC